MQQNYLFSQLGIQGKMDGADGVTDPMTETEEAVNTQGNVSSNFEVTIKKYYKVYYNFRPVLSSQTHSYIWRPEHILSLKFHWRSH